MVTQVDWNDGTGEKIYLSYSSASGDQVVAVTSDENTGPFTRSRDIVFSVSAGGVTISKTLTVIQDASSAIFLIDADGKYVKDADGKYITVQPETEEATVLGWNDTVVTFNDVAIDYGSNV